MVTPLISRILRVACTAGLALGACATHAGGFAANVFAGPIGFTCTGGDVFGGAGFSAASVGPSECASQGAFGAIVSSVASAAGSWVTGDLSASTEAAGNPGSAGNGASIQSVATVTLIVEGLAHLRPGLDSAPFTFGVTGLSGLAGGGPAAPLGGFSSGNIITLSLAAGGSNGTSATSTACLMDNLYSSSCPNGGFGFGFGPGALAPVSVVVHDGDTVQLKVLLESSAYVGAYAGPEGAFASVAVDPLYLDLPVGVTFDSGIDGFLSGVPPVPEPSLPALLGAGLVVLTLARQRLQAAQPR
jgi:hypothetical protein